MGDLVKEKCKAIVENGRWWKDQCKNSATKNGFCLIHHPDSIIAKRKKSFETYKKKQSNAKINLVGNAEARIEDLEKEVEELKAELEYLKGLSQERGEQS